VINQISNSVRLHFFETISFALDFNISKKKLYPFPIFLFCFCDGSGFYINSVSTEIK